ncbi:MAG: WYL domain-containing protein [Lachnospiraceae bacterium]|nr:WYL domain-containing protein [Lachnospiraceae bacterium]
MEGLDFGKNNRILAIYSKLMNGQVVNKAELAQIYGVNPKSIQRDLEDIRNFLDNQIVEEGIPNQLIYDHKQKGYRLEQSNHVKLSNDEILAVSKILLDSRAFTKKEMMSILDKLVESCVPKKNQKLVNELIANERFHYIEPHHHKVFMDKMMVLGQAIKESKVIRIKYTKMKDKAKVERRLEPLAIMFSEYYFYLVGFIQGIDKEKEFENANDPFPTIYRIDRIEDLEILEEHFKIPYANRFEEGEFRKRIQFMYGGKLQRVKFEYTGESIEAVLDRLPTAKVLSEEDGKYVVQAEVFGKGIEMWLGSQKKVINILDNKSS